MEHYNQVRERPAQSQRWGKSLVKGSILQSTVRQGGRCVFLTRKLPVNDCEGALQKGRKAEGKY